MFGCHVETRPGTGFRGRKCFIFHTTTWMCVDDLTRNRWSSVDEERKKCDENDGNGM